MTFSVLLKVNVIKHFSTFTFKSLCFVQIAILNQIFFIMCLFVADIKNTPKAKGVALKFTYEKKKEYSAEILAKLSDTKNKMIAYPKLYIKTPTKDLINVKGSISGKPGSNIRVVITEDKLFRTPISVKGKWAIENMTTPPPPHTHTLTM